MRRPRILVLTMGGTIAAVGHDRLDLVHYGETGRTVRIESLFEEFLEFQAIADIRSEELRDIPSHELTTRDLVEVAAVVVDRIADPDVDGIVITHGTNTLEETAFLLDLTCRTDTPVVVTGAMRPASAISADGPLNLLNAVRVAASPLAAGHGVLVVMNDAILTARDVTKRSTSRLQAFGATDVGPVGFIEGDGEVVFRHRPTPWVAQSAFDLSGVEDLPRVDAISSYLGADNLMVEACVAAGSAGIVVGATGAGFVPAVQERALGEAARQGIVVVFSTRTGSGRVSRRLGPPGFVFARDLNVWKSRILLGCALTVERDSQKIQRWFESGVPSAEES